LGWYVETAFADGQEFWQALALASKVRCSMSGLACKDGYLHWYLSIAYLGLQRKVQVASSTPSAGLCMVPWEH